MKQIIAILGLSFLVSCCGDDPTTDNYGESKTTVTLRALTGMQVFPNGTRMGVYKISGQSGNRTYTLLDYLEFPPLQPGEEVNEASFTYKGAHPVWLRLEPTENPPISLPLKYQSPFENGQVDFWIEDPVPGYVNLRYYPNFWMDFALFTEKSKSNIPGGGFFQIGNEFNKITGVSISAHRNSIGDTVIRPTKWRYLSNNEDFPLLLLDGSKDGTDSLLQTIHFADLTPHDTTYVFYDYDKDSLYTERR